MDLQTYVAVLRRRWLLIVSIALAAIVGAALYTFQATPQYSSAARLFVSTSASDDAQAFQGSQFSLQRVKSYADMVSGNEVAKRVIAQLKLDDTPRELAKQITAISKPDTVILTIRVTDPSPKRATTLANAVAREFVGYVAELETPPGKDEATIKATVIDEATEPVNPVSPKPLRNLGSAALLGLLLGAGLALIRDALDNSVKSDKELENLTHAPVIGSIPFDSVADDHPLITDIDRYSPRSEAFRVLRTNLQFIDPDKNRKVFVVTSALPEEGKSTTACNLAIALAQGGEHVILVEADLRRPRIPEYLKVERSVGLTTVLVGRIDLDEAIQTPIPGLDVLTSGSNPPNPAELLKTQAMSNLIDVLRRRYDVVIIDAPPLLPVTDAALVAAMSDGALLVIRYGKTTRDQVRAAEARLEAVNSHPAGVMLNMTPARRRGLYGGYGYGYGYGYAPVDTKAQQSKGAGKRTLERTGRRSR